MALGVETKSAPAPSPISGKSFARLYSTSALRATIPARAMFTSGRKTRAASRYCAIETSGRSGRLSGSSGTSKLGLHAGHEAQRGHARTPRPSAPRATATMTSCLNSSRRSRSTSVDVGVALGELVLDPLDALVEAVHRVREHLSRVARELHAVVGACGRPCASTGAHFSMSHSETRTFASAASRGRLDLAERVERDDAAEPYPTKGWRLPRPVMFRRLPAWSADRGPCPTAPARRRTTTARSTGTTASTSPLRAARACTRGARAPPRGSGSSGPRARGTR